MILSDLYASGFCLSASTKGDNVTSEGRCPGTGGCPIQSHIVFESSSSAAVSFTCSARTPA